MAKQKLMKSDIGIAWEAGMIHISEIVARQELSEKPAALGMDNWWRED